MTQPGASPPFDDGVDAIVGAQRMAARWADLDQVAGRTGARLAAEATALGIEALRRVGIDATARTCGLGIYSRRAFDLVRRQALPALQWIDHTCANELSPAQVLRQLLAPDLPPGGYSWSIEAPSLAASGSPAPTKCYAVSNPLHMVIEHEAFVADLGLGAFARDELPVASAAVWRKGTDMRPFRFADAVRWVAEGGPTGPVVVLNPGPRLAVPPGPVDRALPANAAEVKSLVDALVAAIRGDDTPPKEDHR